MHARLAASKPRRLHGMEEKEVWEGEREKGRGREGERTDESGTQRRGVARRGPEPRLRRQGDG